MSALTFTGANLPAVASLTTALKAIAEPAPEMGMAILKMDRTGHWVFGADQTEVEDDSKWAVNPFSFVHGWIAWGVGEVLGEKMTSVSNPLPEVDEPPRGAEKGWEKQVGFSLQCISGADKGMVARYTATSVGGKKGVTALAAELAAQVEKDQTKPVPVVLLKKEHYQHKSYGRIYTPIFEVQQWISLDGPTEETAAPKRRRASAE
jgi:hypothetical protein